MAREHTVSETFARAREWRVRVVQCCCRVGNANQIIEKMLKDFRNWLNETTQVNANEWTRPVIVNFRDISTSVGIKVTYSVRYAEYACRPKIEVYA